MKTVTKFCLLLLAFQVIGGCRGCLGCICSPSRTAAVVRVAKDAVQALDAFSHTVQTIQGLVSKTVDKTEAKLSEQEEGKVEVEGAAEYWETQWNKLKGEVEELDEKFKEIESTSQRYFEEADIIAESFSTESRKQVARQENEKKRNEFQLAKNLATVQLEEVHRVFIDGEDFHKELLLLTIHSELNIQIQKLGDLRNKAKDVVGKLDSFTKTSKFIFAAGE